MRKVGVQSLEPILEAPEGTIIGVAGLEECWEVVKRESRLGEFIDFVDKDGKLCRLYVRALGRLPYGQIERRRW